MADKISPTLDSMRLLDTIRSLPDQCHQVITEMLQQEIPDRCYLASNIVVSGMGGSALGGRVIASLERQVLKIPIVVSTEYHLPNFVDQRSLVIVSSYSGNTEETVSSLAEALARKAQVFVICTGGRLAQIASDNGIPHYIFNPKFNYSGQPRMALGYLIMSLIVLLSRCRLIHPFRNLAKLSEYLKSKHSLAGRYEELARTLSGTIPVLITSEHLKGAAHCFKNQLNENSKNMAVLFDLPELNHHLLEGLAFPPTNPDHLHFLFFRSAHFHPKLQTRYAITDKVLKKQSFEVSSVELSGPDRLSEAMELVQAGSFISYFLAQNNGIDPGPVPWVDYFKDVLAGSPG